MALMNINWTPNAKQLRWFGLIGAVFFGILASWLYYRHGTSIYVWVFGLTSVSLAAAGGLVPEVLRYPYLGMMIAAYPIGWTVSHVVLVLIYFGLFTAVATIFRLIGRDALQRKFDPAAASYWQPKRMPTDMSQYLRQY